MAQAAINSLFGSSSPVKASWRSYATSIVIHGVAIGLLFAVAVPAIREVEEVRSHTTLIAPIRARIAPYRPKIVKVARIESPALPARVNPLKVVPQPIVKPIEVKSQPIAAAPAIKDFVPEIHPAAPVEVLKPAPAPKPEVKTGLFAQADLAKGPREPAQVKVGGFGDPNGAPAQNSQQSKLMTAQLGAFDLSTGGGRSGGGGRGQVGLVKASLGGFGAVTASSSTPSAMQGSVRTGGFGDLSSVSPGTGQRAAAAQPVATQVEILFKPKPVYTEEARLLKLEGQVSLDVVFLATGSVQVVRVIHGLGHGLDEAAEAAATQVRFRPATRAGVPVNTPATISITFELS